MKITNISMPTSHQFGAFQVDGLESTYFRFEVQDGQPILDQDFFLAAEQDPDKRQQLMSPSMYKDLQSELVLRVSVKKDDQK
jgi:hypothetical protein